MSAKVIAVITPSEPWGETLPVVNRALTSRENYERALTPGPWHQDSPFRCFYCPNVYSDYTHYPYCSSICAINAENS